MNLASRISKAILSLVERYRVLDILKILAFLLMVWIIGATWLYFTEKDYVLTADELARGDLNYFDTYPRACKNTMVYLFSGFEEYIPHTLAGWLGSILVMLFGSLGLVAILIGKVVSIIQENLREAKLINKKPAHSHFQDHLVVCNWGDKGRQILRQVRDESCRFNQPIVIVSEHADEIAYDNDEALFKDVWAVSGDPSRVDTLQRADVDRAATALILADTLSQPKESIAFPGPHTRNGNPGATAHRNRYTHQARLIDAKTVLIGMTIEALNPDTYTCVELLDKRNEIHLERTHIDEVISGEEFSIKLLAQASISHGLTEVYQHLLTATGDTNEIYKLAVPESLIGKPYAEIATLLRSLSDDLILLGYERQAVRSARNHFGNAIASRKVVLNPPAKSRRSDDKTRKLQLDDTLIIMAYRRPELKDFTLTNGEE